MAKKSREDFGVQDKDQIVLKGTVTFAKTAKAIAGDELVRENERRAKLGMFIMNDPFRAISLDNLSVVKGGGTPLAQYYESTAYTAKATGKPTISLESKSKFAPAYGHLQDGKVVEMTDPEKNPASGQVVYLIINAYHNKKYNKMSSTFDAIIFEEGPIKYYEGGATGALAGFGLPVEALSEQAPSQPSNDVQAPAETSAPAQTEQSAPASGFGSAPVAEATQPNQSGNGFGIQDSDLAGQGTGFGTAGGNGNASSPNPNPFA